MEVCFFAAVASGLLSWGHFISSDIVDLIAQILFKAHGSHCAWLSSCFSFSCFFLFVKHDQFHQGRTAEHLAEHTTKSPTGFRLFGCFAEHISRWHCLDALGRTDGGAGVLMKLRQHGFRMPLPSIHLANLRSLPNKTVEHLLLSWLNKDLHYTLHYMHSYIYI